MGGFGRAALEDEVEELEAASELRVSAGAEEEAGLTVMEERDDEDMGPPGEAGGPAMWGAEAERTGEFVTRSRGRALMPPLLLLMMTGELPPR